MANNIAKAFIVCVFVFLASVPFLMWRAIDNEAVFVKACESRGGVPVTGRGAWMCLAPEALR